MIERNDVVVVFKHVNLNNDDLKTLYFRVKTTQSSSVKKRLNDFDKLINRKRKREFEAYEHIVAEKTSKTRTEKEEEKNDDFDDLFE